MLILITFRGSVHTNRWIGWYLCRIVKHISLMLHRKFDVNLSTNFTVIVKKNFWLTFCVHGRPIYAFMSHTNYTKLKIHLFHKCFPSADWRYPPPCLRGLLDSRTVTVCESLMLNVSLSFRSLIFCSVPSCRLSQQWRRSQVKSWG